MYIAGYAKGKDHQTMNVWGERKVGEYVYNVERVARGVITHRYCV
jgi:hypothetical protein